MNDDIVRVRIGMWASLPYELVRLVLTHLPTEALARASGVNRCWRHVAREEVWRRGWKPGDWARTHHMVCYFCRENRAHLRRTTCKRECSRCRALPAMRLITKTTAMRLGFTAREFARTPCIEIPNPYGGPNDMKLYRMGALWKAREDGGDRIVTDPIKTMS